MTRRTSHAQLASTLFRSSFERLRRRLLIHLSQQLVLAFFLLRVARLIAGVHRALELRVLCFRERLDALDVLRDDLLVLAR